MLEFSGERNDIYHAFQTSAEITVDMVIHHSYFFRFL